MYYVFHYKGRSAEKVIDRITPFLDIANTAAREQSKDGHTRYVSEYLTDKHLYAWRNGGSAA